MNRRSRYLRTGLFVAAFAALGTTAVSFLASGNGGGEYAVVRKGNIEHSLVALGRVESDATVEIAPEFTGRILEVAVDEGDRVEPGQVLVRIDDAVLRAEYERAGQALRAAKARWDEVSRGTRPEVIVQAKAKAAARRGTWELARAELAEVLRGPRPEEIRDAEAQVELSAAAAKYAARQLERESGLAANDATSESKLDELRKAAETAQATLKSRKARLDKLKNGATEEEKQQARAAVSAAKAEYDRSKARLEELLAGPTEEERRAARADYQRARAEVRRLEARLEETVLKSPLPAVVLRRYKEPGELAYPQQLLPEPILVLGDAQERRVRIEVMEYDVYKVRTGQKAWITSDGYPGKRWQGTVTRVAPVMGKKRLSSQNPKEKADVKVLEAWIRCDALADLPLNLPVEVRIAEPLREDVLVIPGSAVDGQGRVRLYRGGERAIEIGARDSGFVEVLSGLQKGDKVLLNKP